MKIVCSCLVMVLLISGCATTGKVDQMIDSNVAPQVEQIKAKIVTQAVASSIMFEDMKGFIVRLGTALDADVKAIQSDVDDLTGQMAAVKRDTSSTQSDVKALRTEISEMGGSEEVSLDVVLDSLSAKVTALDLSIEKLQKAAAASVEAEAAAAEAKAALPAKGLFHKHAAGVVE